MKKITLYILLLISCYVQAQIGIGTGHPRASLHIKGTTNNILKIDSINSNIGKMTISKDGNVGFNTSIPTKPLHIKDGLHISGLQNKIQDTLTYRHVLIADQNGNTATVPFDGYFYREEPNIRSVKYTVKSTQLNIPNFHPDSTIVTLDGLSIRYNYDPNPSSPIAFLQVKVDRPNYFAIYYKKAGTGTGQGNPSLELRYYKNNSRLAATPDVWYDFPTNFNAYNRDIGSALILLSNDKYVYRVTLNANGENFFNANTDGVPIPDPQITIFLEQVISEL